jgi:hypothetical protein
VLDIIQVAKTVPLFDDLETALQQFADTNTA